MKLLHTFLMIIISRNLYLSYTTAPEDEEEGVDAGVLNFHDYYTCYFNKYFNISPDQESPRRDKVRRVAKNKRLGYQ